MSKRCFKENIMTFLMLCLFEWFWGFIFVNHLLYHLCSVLPLDLLFFIKWFCLTVNIQAGLGLIVAQLDLMHFDSTIGIIEVFPCISITMST